MGNCIGKFNVCSKSSDFEPNKIPLAPLKSGLEHNYLTNPFCLENQIVENKFTSLLQQPSIEDNGVVFSKLSNSLSQPHRYIDHEYDKANSACHQNVIPPITDDSGVISSRSSNSCNQSHKYVDHEYDKANCLNLQNLIPPIICNGNPVIMVAIFDYHCRTKEELSLRKGDTVIVLNDIDPEWWFVENNNLKERGYVPSPFVAEHNSVEAEDWFFRNISRKDSERLLLLNGNPEGTFLIRKSETSKDSYSLSLRDGDVHQSVKHYKIKHSDNHFYITSHKIFDNLFQLVKYYCQGAYGLSCKLSLPCPRPAPVTSDLSFKTKDSWEISFASLTLYETLGVGQFGKVIKGKWNGTTPVAVKTIKDGAMSKDDFLKEAKIMKNLNHPKLVKLYAVCTEGSLCIITELMTHGSLLKYLQEGPGQHLEIVCLVDMMAQIASGMCYLEKMHYIHRDLAARNILVGDNNMVKIADFGLARMMLDNNGTYEAKQGAKIPIKWTAPEAAVTGRFTIKSDVWSFGIVLYEIITYGGIPYPTMHNTEALRQLDDGYRMPCPKNCPPGIYSVMIETWHGNPDDRPTFEYLCEYFEEFFVRTEPNYKKTD